MDKAYDSDQIRDWLKAQGAYACIPPRSNRTRPAAYNKRTYKHRHRTENFFEKLKRAPRIATRYDKLAASLS